MGDSRNSNAFSSQGPKGNTELLSTSMRHSVNTLTLKTVKHGTRSLIKTSEQFARPTINSDGPFLWLWRCWIWRMDSLGRRACISVWPKSNSSITLDGPLLIPWRFNLENYSFCLLPIGHTVNVCRHSDSERSDNHNRERTDDYY